MSIPPASVRVVRDRAKVACLGATELPWGYALTVTRGSAWKSYGYLQEDSRGRLLSAAIGYGTACEAGVAAQENEDEQLRQLQAGRSGAPDKVDLGDGATS